TLFPYTTLFRSAVPGKALPMAGHWENRSASVRSFNGRNPVMQKKLMGAVALAAVATLAASSAAMAGPPASKMSKATQATVVQPGMQVAIVSVTGHVRAPMA